jgi:Flp pilus assembly protein TadG
VFLNRLWDDTDGVILPYVAIMLVAMLGLFALAVDASRLMLVQTQVQHAADALALAGAAELDRRPDSIIRAQAAIHDLVANPVTGAEIDQVAEIAGIDFLRSLPPGDDLPVTSTNLTDDPTLAAYVQVTVKPVTLGMLFPMSLMPGHRTVGIGARAVAGYDQIVCKGTPVFVCNPYESQGMSYFQATQALVAADQASASHSRLVRLARSQLNSGYSAGDFGYLAPATGSLPASACGPGGEAGIPQALAATTVAACFRLSGVHPVPSDDQPAMDGLNTRFDLYANGFHSCHGYPPDTNVRKGYTATYNADWCNNAIPANPGWPMPVAAAAALPVDQNMINPATQSLNSHVTLGSGVWDCATYWSVAHASGPGKNSPPPGCTAAATIARYSVYQYELNFLDDSSLGGEFGGPRCVTPGVPDRRIITAAIVNCGSSPVSVLNYAQDVPVAAFGRFFLTLPATSGDTDGNPYAEFVGLVKRSDPNSMDMVQLYR